MDEISRLSYCSQKLTGFGIGQTVTPTLPLLVILAPG